MTEKNEDPFGMASMVDTWIKSMGDFWGNMDDMARELYEVVYQEDRVKLKHYKARTKILYKTPLLITYALINRETMLELQPGRSVVERFWDSGLTSKN